MKTKNYSRFISFAVFTMILAFMPLTKVMAADLSAPQLGIKSASDKMRVKMEDPAFTSNFKEVHAFVNSVIYPQVDFHRISALVLGKHWKHATADEKSRFNQEFQIMLVRTYARAFVEFDEWSVRFLPLNMEAGDRKIIMKTEVLQPGKQPIAINYRMLNSKGQWKIYDIMIEGVSLVTNYRTSFKNEIARSGSLAEVIETLAKRNKKALAKGSS